ncbi:Hypothetical predicted protein [Cloeon dipterum]|uniref:Uncharacterized protein n=1 Tax=Cloeon dipterum TaxID=197152 RepID=A0A8S1DPB3_9INSE|nr:Hypothetical predicted protein [Cloeon dipterum]
MGPKVALLVALLLATSCVSTSGLIIPEELPSLLSIIYSNIPPIKNGFDTRFGVGFRLGQHADVQFLTEIGPQLETDQLGGEQERRRHAVNPPTPQETMRRETLLNKDKAEEQPQENWLLRWRQSLPKSSKKEE